jgi:Family of unknown function (DUF6178)
MSDRRAYGPDAFNRLPFRDQLDALYGISARDRCDLILSSPDAQRLVRSFAAESLFHTIKEIGLEDGAELLALASGEQVCTLLDLDCWKKDRLETAAVLDWLEALVEAGDRALGEFLNSVDRDLLVLLLKRFVRVQRREDPEEPEEDVEGPEVFELDQHYRIIFYRLDARSGLVRQLIEALYERDYSYFITVMEDIWWGVESDLEEASFRLRNARLQDRGFPDYYEAQQIYGPLRAGELPERSQPLGRSVADDSQAVPQDRALVALEDGESFLSQVLNTSFAGEAASELRHELAYLVNRVLVAEGVDFADRERVIEKIRVAHDTVNLALESLSQLDARTAAGILDRHYIQHLFRVAWDLLVGLRKSARRAVEALGIESATAEISFLDTPYREGLAGLLRPKPQFYEGITRRGEIRYRAFATLADFEQAERLIADVASLGELCQRLLQQSPAQLAKLRPREADDFRISAAVLTGVAHLLLGRAPSVEPLNARELSDLRETMLDSAAGELRTDLRRRILEWMPGHTGFLEFSLRRLEEEFLATPPGQPVDPRFVTCLMIRPAKGGREASPDGPRS